MRTKWNVLLAIAGAVLTYLAVVIFCPCFPSQRELARGARRVKSKPKGRQDVTIDAGGTPISAWLYLPEGATGPGPCVMLSNGLGGTKDAVVEPYALQFAANGIAAITYDYRCFGESGGEPRQFFSSIAQQEDLQAVIAFARTRAEIDGDRIILWSTSAAGRYGINVAAKDPRIAGVIAQCASLDHAKDDRIVLRREGLGYMLRLFMHAQRDKGRSRFGLSPHLIPIVGRPGTLALMNAPGALEGYQTLMADSDHFVNGVCARVLLTLQGPDATQTARDVRCPVLILVCEQDTLVAPDSHAAVAATLGDKATVVKFPVGHFDIYRGEPFRKAMAVQLDFVKAVAAGGATEGAAPAVARS